MSCGAKDCTVNSNEESLFSLPRPFGATTYSGTILFFCQRHCDKATQMYASYKDQEQEHKVSVYYRCKDIPAMYAQITKAGYVQGVAKIMREIECIHSSIVARSNFADFISTGLYDANHKHYCKTMKARATEMIGMLASEHTGSALVVNEVNVPQWCLAMYMKMYA